MAELIGFSFRDKPSLFHHLDPRTKLACFLIISLTIVRAHFPALALICMVIIFSLQKSHIPLQSVLYEFRFFLFLLFFVFLVRALFSPGTPVIETGLFTVTHEGLRDGLLVCVRLLFIALLGLLFISTTRSSEIRAAVAWFLGPFPMIPAKRVATMLGLIVRFIPVILYQVNETIEAQRARGIENRKNPIYRAKSLVLPLVRRTFENADRLAIAMAARCYHENRTGDHLSIRKRDGIVISLVVCVCVIGLWMGTR